MALSRLRDPGSPNSAALTIKSQPKYSRDMCTLGLPEAWLRGGYCKHTAQRQQNQHLNLEVSVSTVRTLTLCSLSSAACPIDSPAQ